MRNPSDESDAQSQHLKLGRWKHQATLVIELRSKDGDFILLKMSFLTSSNRFNF
jgi:hypothetical protein